ncbi:MAG: hypothetical protein KC591_18270, partial [Gemmatimonadetes bacterium]|nr:hypothetical protein [Gemmatimonadota bacterium]
LCFAIAGLPVVAACAGPTPGGAPPGTDACRSASVVSVPPHRDRFGVRLGVLDDLNGDGVPEIAVADPCTETDCVAGLVRVVSLNDRDELFAIRIEGEAGRVIALAPLENCDGDGVRDLAIGLPNCDPEHGGGRVRIVSGSSGSEIRTIRLGPESGEASSMASFGAALAAIRAPTESPPARLATFDMGRREHVREFRGRVTLVDLGGSPAWSLEGAERGEALGRSLDAVGDADGDGWGDVVVRNRAGRVLLLSGRTGAALFDAVLPWSGSTYDSAALLPDIDGDAIPELVVGSCPQEDDSGTFGSITCYSWSRGTELWSVDGSIAFGWGLGAALEVVGDLDGDDVSDVAVTAMFEGRLHLLSGRDGSCIDRSERHGIWFGAVLESIGDIDSDGIEDLVVGNALDAPRALSVPGTLYVWRSSRPGEVRAVCSRRDLER